MVTIKNKLTKKDELKIFCILDELNDYYSDFYITKNNLRLFIKDNLLLMFKDLAKGNKIIFNDKGVAIITGYADKNNRKYLKILAMDKKTYKELLYNIEWNIQDDLYVKIKSKNPIWKVLLDNRFKVFQYRGKEVLLYKKGKSYERFKNRN